MMRGSEYKILKTTQSLLFFPFFINKEKRRRRREALTVCIDYSWKARTDVYTSEPSGCFFCNSTDGEPFKGRIVVQQVIYINTYATESNVLQ